MAAVDEDGDCAHVSKRVEIQVNLTRSPVTGSYRQRRRGALAEACGDFRRRLYQASRLAPGARCAMAALIRC